MSDLTFVFTTYLYEGDGRYFFPKRMYENNTNNRIVKLIVEIRASSRALIILNEFESLLINKL